MSEWQPIETAPMDMTPIWIRYKHGSRTFFAHAQYVPRFTENCYSDNAEYSEEKDDFYTFPGWYEICLSNDEYQAMSLDGEPTHWMPLPEAPMEFGL